LASEAALATLDHVAATLAPLGRPLAVMGGISLAAWNYIRATRDVDLLIAVEATEIASVVEALRLAGFRPKHSPPIRAIGDHHFVQFLYTPPGEF
jgi:hypothetical protein